VGLSSHVSGASITFDETFDPVLFADRADFDLTDFDFADLAAVALDFFAATCCFLNFAKATGRLAEVVLEAFAVLAAIAGSPEKLIQIPAAATSAANTALLIRMAISPFARATSNDEKTGAEWLQDGRKRESCDQLPLKGPERRSGRGSPGTAKRPCSRLRDCSSCP
jgi:hypothetical protein